MRCLRRSEFHDRQLLRLHLQIAPLIEWGRHDRFDNHRIVGFLQVLGECIGVAPCATASLFREAIKTTTRAFYGFAGVGFSGRRNE